MTLELTAKNRTVFGKKTRNLRKRGLLPAELYGHNIENVHLSIPEKDFIKVHREAGEHAIVNLILEDGKKVPVLISETQYNTLSEKFFSADFHQIKINEKITTQIPVILNGEAPAIKAGYVTLHVLQEISIESFPENIPDKFDIDISNLQKPGDSISIENLNVSNNIKILAHPKTVIVIVQEKKVKKEEEPAPATEVTEKKFETEEKKTEEK